MIIDGTPSGLSAKQEGIVTHTRPRCPRARHGALRPVFGANALHGHRRTNPSAWPSVWMKGRREGESRPTETDTSSGIVPVAGHDRFPPSLPTWESPRNATM